MFHLRCMMWLGLMSRANRSSLNSQHQGGPAAHRERGALSGDPPVGDAEVDFVRCELRCAGRPVDLTPVEFKLLTTFVRSPGRVFTRQQLLDQVWGHGVFVSDRVVDNQIMNLRKKIEPQPRRPRFLVSVRAIGYRFDG